MLMMIELFLSRQCFVWSHAVALPALAVVYVAMQWVRIAAPRPALDWHQIHHSVGDAWAYPFLDTATELAGAWYIGLIVLHLLFFGGMLLLVKLRDRIAKSPFSADA